MLARADFLRIVAVAGAGWTLSLELAPVADAAPATWETLGWIRLAPDGLVTLMLNKSEMGQGVTTSFAMLVADELDVPLDRMRYTFAPADARWNTPGRDSMSTGGSTSIRTMNEALRKVGASAKAMLIAAAAQQWNVAPSACRGENATVFGPNGQRVAYGALIALAQTLPIPTDPPLKTPAQFRLIGTRQFGIDVPVKTYGRALYGLDVRVPGMKFASIEKPPEIGASVATYDEAAARQVHGVRGVYRVSSGIGVVADTSWAAFVGRKALRATFAPGPNHTASTPAMYAGLRALAQQPGTALKHTGDAPAALAAGRPITAIYELPYLAHAAMEPMNATAAVRPDGVTVWAPTQSPTAAQNAAAQAAGVAPSAVTLNVTYLGGGFGRRLSVDYVADAVEVAKQAGVPVQVVWTREDDVRHDPYRPGSVNALAATLAPDGTVAAYRHTIAVASGRTDVDAGVLHGSGDFDYTIPNVLVDAHAFGVRIPTGPWRAPYANANTFATESFIDELAHAAGKDPLQFRLAMLPPNARSRHVLERVAARSNWGHAATNGRALGLALTTWGDSWAATVAAVSMPNAASVRVEHLWCVVDCGQPVNLDGLDAQLTSGLLYGLSAALLGKITFTGGVADQSNFNDYHVLHMSETPTIEVEVVPSTQPPTGAGEIGTPGIAPAVANALFALTGKRVRNLPLLENIT